MNGALSGKRVLVTGGGGCLGRAIVEQLSVQGAVVATFDRDAERLAALQADRPAVKVWEVDLTNSGAVDEAVEDAFAVLGGLDALVNNAGIIRNGTLIDPTNRRSREIRLQHWDEVLATNLTAVYSLTMAVVERMVRKRLRGVIVSIGSISARGIAGQGAYSAAKAGLEALTVTWAKELGPLGIRAVCVSPGFMDTSSTRVALSPEKLDELRREVPLRRLGHPDEVALAVRHLIENDYINGTILGVDGGLAV